jgi:hypothetical protein
VKRVVQLRPGSPCLLLAKMAIRSLTYWSMVLNFRNEFPCRKCRRPPSRILHRPFLPGLDRLRKTLYWTEMWLYGTERRLRWPSARKMAREDGRLVHRH